MLGTVQALLPRQHAKNTGLLAASGTDRSHAPRLSALDQGT